MQQNYIVAKRKYKANSKVICINAIAKKVAIDKSDLPTVYYSALDCAFIASITSDDSEYHEALLAYLQSYSTGPLLALLYSLPDTSS